MPQDVANRFPSMGNSCEVHRVFRWATENFKRLLHVSLLPSLIKQEGGFTEPGITAFECTRGHIAYWFQGPFAVTKLRVALLLP
jgi:hypothetical protein